MMMMMTIIIIIMMNYGILWLRNIITTIYICMLPLFCNAAVLRSTMADLIGSGRSIAAATTAMQLMAAPAALL